MLRASIRAQLSTPWHRSTTQPPSGRIASIGAGVRIGARSVLLSASRTEISRDDRGPTLASLVSRLSSYQLRVHYIIYHIFFELYGGSNTPVTQSRDRVTLTTFMPQLSLLVAMDFSESEPGQMIMEHALVELSREELFAPTLGLRRTVFATATRLQWPGTGTHS
jgi:hypothetical protein